MSYKYLQVMITGLALAVGLSAQGLNTTATKSDWEDINFEFNSSILSDGYPTLLRLADLLGKHPDYHVLIDGNTDYVGSEGYNKGLSLARANAVRDFLLKYGAAPNQLKIVALGKTRPLVSNRTNEGRFMNRRVVLTVLDSQNRPVPADIAPAPPVSALPPAPAPKAEVAVQPEPPPAPVAAPAVEAQPAAAARPVVAPAPSRKMRCGHSGATVDGADLAGYKISVASFPEPQPGSTL